jgi:hypothetical protein
MTDRRQISANNERSSERLCLRVPRELRPPPSRHDYQLTQRLDHSFDCHREGDQQELDALVYHKPDTALCSVG